MLRWSCVREARHGVLLLAMALAGSADAEIRGRVVVDDGIPPARPIRVELRCAGREPVRTEADSEGRFAIAPAAAGNCAITATLAGYQKASIAAGRLPLDPEIAGLALMREGKWQGYALSAGTLAAPEQALVLYADGVRALRAGGAESFAKAERLFAGAAEADPRFAEASFQLGRLRLSRGDADGARMAFGAASRADPWFLSPYQPLLMLEYAGERWSAVRTLCDQWLRLTPHAPDARYYRGLSALEERAGAAAKADLRSLEEGPEGASPARLHYLRGRIYEYEGRVAEAVAEYRNYIAAEPDGAEADDARARAKGAGRR